MYKWSEKKQLELVNRYIKSPFLQKHAFAVEAVMRELADHLKENKELYQTAGLLHDLDWELTNNMVDQHGIKTVEIIKQYGLNDLRICEAIQAHNYLHNGFRLPKGNLEWSLYCSDELTGFIVAVALVMPDKKLESVTVDKVLCKFPQKAFAARVNREQIMLCEEKLGIHLDDFIAIALKAMKSISADLGL